MLFSYIYIYAHLQLVIRLFATSGKEPKCNEFACDIHISFNSKRVPLANDFYLLCIFYLSSKLYCPNNIDLFFTTFEFTASCDTIVIWHCPVLFVIQTPGGDAPLIFSYLPFQNLQTQNDGLSAELKAQGSNLHMATRGQHCQEKEMAKLREMLIEKDKTIRYGYKLQLNYPCVFIV